MVLRGLIDCKSSSIQAGRSDDQRVFGLPSVRLAGGSTVAGLAA